MKIENVSKASSNLRTKCRVCHGTITINKEHPRCCGVNTHHQACHDKYMDTNVSVDDKVQVAVQEAVRRAQRRVLNED